MAKRWLIAAVFAGGVFGAYRMSGCLSKDPDQKLAGRFDDMCEIAERGADAPVRGVQELGRYLGNHTDDILGELGGTIAMIEKIPDDDAHDKRARVARDRIQKPLIDCAETWERFAEAIDDSPEAIDLVERGLDRLERTLDIIFGNGGDARGTDVLVDFRHLPDQLRHRFDIVRITR